MKRLGIAVAMVCLSALGAPASADLVPLTQTRTVRASVYITDQPDFSETREDSREAADFAPFDGFVSVSAELSGATASAFAGHTSSITPDRILFAASASTQVATVASNQTSSAAAASVFLVTFHIGTAGEWVIDASGSRNGTTPFLLLYLQTETPEPETLVYIEIHEGTESRSIMLPEGDYRLYIEHNVASGVLGGPGSSSAIASGSFDFHAVPAPGGAGLMALAIGAALRRRARC